MKLLGLARELATPLVFRAGGTSLNGQTQTDSILVDVRPHWHRVRIEDGGARARVQPGVVLGHVNRMLARRGRRLGPDPASTNIACVGGVVANNSGGMRCGVVADSYRTVRAMKLVLANGAVIDTATDGAEERFASLAPELARGLAEIRDELRADAELAARVAAKFEIKNTTGYRLCAFLDADTPLEIFRRLVVGSEGTLAFLAEAVFETVPLGRHTTLALVGFEDIDAAADAVPALVAAGDRDRADGGADADRGGLEHARHPGGVEGASADLGRAAGRVPRRAARGARRARARSAGDPRRAADDLAAGVHTRARGDRDAVAGQGGDAGAAGGDAPAGVTLLIEDVCVPPARIAEGAKDLQALLGKHGFLPGVAGHASAGNLHFMLTPNFGEQADLERYDAFMHELVELIVDKYDGSLKAEHGTGINMAPFVEREWGPRRPS